MCPISNLGTFDESVVVVVAAIKKYVRMVGVGD